MQLDRWDYLDLLVEGDVVTQINSDEAARPIVEEARYRGKCITSVMTLLEVHGWQICGFARNGKVSRFLFKRCQKASSIG